MWTDLVVPVDWGEKKKQFTELDQLEMFINCPLNWLPPGVETSGILEFPELDLYASSLSCFEIQFVSLPDQKEKPKTASETLAGSDLKNADSAIKNEMFMTIALCGWVDGFVGGPVDSPPMGGFHTNPRLCKKT